MIFLHTKIDWSKIKIDLKLFNLVRKKKKALGQSDCRIPESTISEIRIDEWTWYSKNVKGGF